MVSKEIFVSSTAVTSAASASFKAYGFLMTAGLLWAGNTVVSKLAVGHIDPVTLSTLRWLSAFGLIAVFSIKPLRRDWPHIRRHWPLLLGYGAAGFGLFNIVLYSALNLTSATNVVIEHAAMPAVIFALNYAIFRARASLAQIAGFSLTLFGVLVTASHGDLMSLIHLNLNRGDALMGLCVLLYAGYTIALRFKPDIHWQSLMAVSALGAVLACLPALGLQGMAGKIIWPDATGWAIVAYTALLPALVAQVAYVWGVELIGANRAGLFINMIPIFGVGLSVLILREPLHGYHFVALVLVCAGITLAELGRPKSAT